MSRQYLDFIVSKYLFHFSVIYIIVINLSSMIFFLGQLNIYKLLFIYPFAKFVTPHELPQKIQKKDRLQKEITDPPEMFMFHGSTSQVSFQVDLSVPHPFRPPVDRLPSWPRIASPVPLCWPTPGPWRWWYTSQ